MDKLIAEAPRIFIPGFTELLPMIAFAVIALALIGVVLIVIVRHLLRRGSPDRGVDENPRSELYSNH